MSSIINDNYESESKPPLISFSNFSFRYSLLNKPTLKNIHFDIQKGEKIVILGPSGSGKSTLMHCINGLIPFSCSGEITGSLKIKSKETRDMNIFSISKSVGTVLQDLDSQFVGMSVAEDIAFSLENDCIPVEALHTKVLEVSKFVDVENLLDLPPKMLSGGQKQRVSLAGVMVEDVDVLLFDEPLSNLDPKTAKQAVEWINKLHKQKNNTIIIIEHRLEEILFLNPDRVIVIDESKIIVDTTPSELFKSSILKEHGLREPLYVTALKKSGIDIRDDMNIENIENLRLNVQDKQSLKKLTKTSNSLQVATEKEQIFEVSDICFSYRNRDFSLKNISFGINKGELLAIVGKNGAGKSTLSKIICGFEKQNSGSLKFLGNDFSSLSIKERANYVGYVLQNPNHMISKSTVVEEVTLGLKIRNLEQKYIDKKLEETLKICSLWEYRNWPISSLSFGQKKRMTIASVLILDPSIIILDEPTSGQDYSHYVDIMEFLSKISGQGVSVVMITHDMHLMLEYADRVIAFSNGTIIKEGSPIDIITDLATVENANLRETSLQALARPAEISDVDNFIESFVSLERGSK